MFLFKFPENHENVQLFRTLRKHGSNVDVHKFELAIHTKGSVY